MGGVIPLIKEFQTLIFDYIFNINNMSLNIIGFVLTLLGGIIMYIFNPKEQTRYYMYNREEYPKIEQKAKQRKSNHSIGFILFIIGSVMQLVILFNTAT